MFWRNIEKKKEEKEVIRAVFFGKFEFESRTQGTTNDATTTISPMLQRLKDDISLILEYDQERSPTKDFSGLSMIEWLANTPKTALFGPRWLSAFGSAPRVKDVDEVERNDECDLCGKKFATKQGLAAHRRITHRKHDDLRNIITDEKCIVCNVTFCSRQGARDHFTKRCHKKISKEELEKLKVKAKETSRIMEDERRQVYGKSRVRRKEIHARTTVNTIHRYSQSANEPPVASIANHL